ncbi:MAG: molybdopterin-dependent oxidoreductase [Bradymonadales bacterium]|nr:molybdopterin-dependent oxidoreductase [Bradymonadales bacterium]
MAELNRRDFLRLGTATAAGAGVALASGGAAEATEYNRERADRPRERHHPPNPTRVIPTVCGVCFWKCGVHAEVGEDGTLLHLKGNPRHPLSRGKLCPRGVGGIGMHEDSDRLRYPMRRTGRRGEGLFERITWEEAFDEIGRRLQAVLQEHGPGAVSFITHGPSEGHFAHFCDALGTPLHNHPSYGQCKGPRDTAFKLTFGIIPGSPENIDLENTDCVVLFGSHLGENMHNSQVQEFVEARQRGAKIIVADPRRSTAAEKADLWLQIKPGTDLALALAWTHILIRDQAWDREFVERHCTGFEQLAAHVRRYTPEWAAGETGLTVEEIEAAARLVKQAAPHVIFHPGRQTTWYGDDTQRIRATAILVALTGSWGVRGGYYIPQSVKLPAIHDAFPEVPPYPEPAARVDPGYPFGYAGTVSGVRTATLEDKIKFWLVSGTNLVMAMPSVAETVAAIDKLDTLVVIDILPTEITQYADILLPSTAYLEHPELLFVTPERDPYVAMLQKVADPPGEARCECEIARGIAHRIGLDPYCAWNSQEEFSERMVARYNQLHPDHPIDIDRLRREGVVVVEQGVPIYREGYGLGPDGSGRAGADLTFPEFDGALRSNRVRLYSEDLARVFREKLAAGEPAAGFEPIPTYYRPRPGPPGLVRLAYGRSPVHSFTRTQNLPPLFGREPENRVWVSPGTARAFGIQTDGEMVNLINQDDVLEGPVRVFITSRIRDDLVYMTHGHGRNSRQLTRAYRRGASDTELITRYVIDPLCGATAMRVNFVRLARLHSA